MFWFDNPFISAVVNSHYFDGMKISETGEEYTKYMGVTI